METVTPVHLYDLILSISEFLIDRAFTPTATAVEPIFRDVVGPGFSEADFGFDSFYDLFAAATEYRLSSTAPLPQTERRLTAGHQQPRAHTPVQPTIPPLTEVFGLLREIVLRLEDRDQRPLAAVVKPFLRDALGGAFSEAAYGYRAFKDFLLAASEAGYVTLEQGEHDIVLATTPEDEILEDQTSGSRVPEVEPLSLDQAFDLLVQVVTAERDAGASTFAGRIKPILKRQSEGAFSERALGFSSFYDFLQQAEAQDLVRLQGRPGMNSSIIDIYPVAEGPVDFADIRFGYSSASAESVRDPGLLIEGFYDPRDIAKRLRSGPEFLVLGYKGSGKSSIAEHLRLLSGGDSDLMVDLIDLRDFPIETLRTIVGSPAASPQLLQLGWAWLLLLRAFQSLISDQGASPSDDQLASRLTRQLGKQGLLPTRSVRALSLKSAEISVQAGVASILELGAKATFEGNTGALDTGITMLREVVSTYQTDTRHLIIIDGVDELLSPDSSSFVAIGSLLDQIDDLNALFFRRDSATKLILMCRSDLYERVPNPNKNKMRQDFAIILQWFGDVREESELLRLIRVRAALSGYRGDDPLSDFLPRRLRFEREDENTKDLMISQTRHTPRDLISALTAVQRYSDGPSVSFSAIRRGLEAYSHDYFVPELKDELHGYLSPDYIEELFGLLSSVGRRVFRLEDVSKMAERRGLGEVDLLKGLQILFECSAVGHAVPRGDHMEYRFRFQYPNLAVNPDLPFVIHRGAWKALSLQE